MTRLVSGSVKSPTSSPVVYQANQDHLHCHHFNSEVFPFFRERELRPEHRALLIAGVAPLVVALAAHVSFPLPFTPVPFSLQPLAVLGVGLALGPWNGALAMLSYLGEGALGAPVFSPTGPGGILQLLGPTGGFLLAYPAVAFLCGGLTQRWTKQFAHFTRAVLACTVATIFLFLTGSLWLHAETHLTLRQTLFAAVLPFLPGECVKVLAAAGIYQALYSYSSGSNAR